MMTTKGVIYIESKRHDAKIEGPVNVHATSKNPLRNSCCEENIFCSYLYRVCIGLANH